MDFRVFGFCVFEFVTLFVIANALTPDGLALLDFKTALTSDPANITSNWQVTDSSPCSWGGVTCTASGLVIGLDLSSQQISGVISPSLGKLQSLQFLDISVNLFVGVIPLELGNCSSLLELNLNDNYLNGSIPRSLGSLHSVKHMNISWNNLGGEIPPELGNLGNLTFLDVDNNYLVGNIPESFGDLLLLEDIFLDFNNLIGSIPEDLFSLPKLKTVDLSFNTLTGLVPPMIFNNTNLIFLRINDNELIGDISAGLQALTMNPTMWYFDCGKNAFNGSIPRSLGNMTSLFLFFIHSNQFTGSIPPSIGKLTNLAWLGVGDNSLSGPIPPEIGQLKQLVYFMGYNNTFTGPIPSELGECTMLEQLSLANNTGLTKGNISSLTKLINVYQLDLSSTFRSGELPLALYNMTSLQILSLQGNNFTGSILPEIGYLQNLVWLDIGRNFFSGLLPNDIENCTGLNVLSFTTNNFHGILPANYWNLKHLTITTGSLNPFSPGPFPSALAEFVNITEISFYGVSFTGMLPPSLGTASYLTYLGLYGSSLNGSIPSGLCYSTVLAFLDLSNNHFEGAIPTSLAQCATLQTFLVNNNRLTTLPIGFVTNLTSLAYFDISFNLFGGLLPMDFGGHSNLLTLNLNNNNFSGNLSTFDFGHLPSLVRLNLSTNILVGSIPTSIANCVDLFELDLSVNNLNGNISTLAKMIELQNLYLQGNKLSGLDTINFTQLNKLTNLNLASNEWNTTIPSKMGGLLSLQSLNMSYGQLSGSLPSSLKALQDLQVFDLSHNELNGTIPSELGNLSLLYSINISFNNLIGSVPPEWVRLLKADLVDFSANPGLCQNYSSNTLQCLNLTSTLLPIDDDRPISNRMVVVIVLCSTLIIMMVVSFLGWWYFLLRKKCQRLGEKPIFFTTVVGKEIKVFDVMEATENMSSKCLLKKNSHGAVYKGLLKPERPIILKTFEIANGDVHSLQSYLAEIELLQSIKHRNIVKLLGFCKWSDIALILYDYIPNGDLDNALHSIEKSTMLDWPTRLYIAKGVAHGIAYLHHSCTKPIIHRDIKASNVLLDKNFEPLLTDFGIARIMATKKKDGSIESTTLVAGTYGYMAPECGSGAKVSLKVDIYSYGVLLLELLTGKRPVDKAFGNFLHIVLYVREILQKQKLSLGDLIDPDLFIGASQYEQVQMLDVLNVALYCTKDNPSDRPSSTEIEDMLHRSCSNVDPSLNDGKGSG